MKHYFAIIFCSCMVLVFQLGVTAVRGQSDDWSEFESISNVYELSTVSKIASDEAGNVHVMWSADSRLSDGRLSVYYSRLVDGV